MFAIQAGLIYLHPCGTEQYMRQRLTEGPKIKKAGFMTEKKVIVALICWIQDKRTNLMSLIDSAL